MGESETPELGQPEIWNADFSGVRWAIGRIPLTQIGCTLRRSRSPGLRRPGARGPSQPCARLALGFTERLLLPGTDERRAPEAATFRLGRWTGGTRHLLAAQAVPDRAER